MKNSWVLISSALLFIGTIFSCQKEIMDQDIHQPARLTVYLTDHATPVFDSIFIEILKLEVKLEDDTLAGGGWMELVIHPGVYNILRFRNGLDTLFATGVLPTRRLTKLRLTLGTQNSVMKDSQRFSLMVKDDEREVVAKIDNSNFEFLPPDQILFWIDFDAGRSIQVDNSGPGNNNGFELKAHIKIFARSKSGRIEGRVLPKDSDPVVMAIIGSDTATAIPDDDDGDFKIPGLRAGTYRVFIDGNNGFNDTTIQNILVKNNEDIDLGTIALHK